LAADLTIPELESLRRTFLFSALTDTELSDVLARPDCSAVSYEKGDIIYSPHTFLHSLGAVLSGAVEVTKGEFVVSILREGTLFGAAALFNGETEYATTLTVRQSCRAVFFPQALVARLMEEYPAFDMAYVKYLSERIRFLSGKLEEVTAGSAGQKVEQYLLARLRGDRAVLDCPATILAKKLNISRASLYRVFETLEKSGAIRREGKTVILTGNLERRQI
jgi:CRP-like cAMP-binding protein